MVKHRLNRNYTVISLTSGGRQNQESFLFQPQEQDTLLQQQTPTNQDLSQQQLPLYIKNWPTLIQKNEDSLEDSSTELLETSHVELLEMPHENLKTSNEELETPHAELLDTHHALIKNSRDKFRSELSIEKSKPPKKSKNCSYQIMSKFDGCTQIPTIWIKTYKTHKRACEFCSTWINYERKKLGQMENSLHEKLQTGSLTFLKWSDCSWTATTEL